jgi:protein-S-isoprenylcysteine O-methyltransferase Ste14
MDTERAFDVMFWTLLAVGLSMRTWFAFRVWRSGERIAADRAARAREGLWPHVIAYAALMLLVAVALQLCFGGGLRRFAFAAPAWLRWAGLVFGIACAGLFAWTHVVLGRFWSPYLQLRPGHQIVSAGPYARIRHPMYSAIIGWMISLGLVAANWIPLVFAALVATNFRLRIEGEEKMMLQQFGHEYREYMKRTGRLLPAVRD